VQENVEVDIEKLAALPCRPSTCVVKRAVPPQTHDSGSRESPVADQDRGVGISRDVETTIAGIAISEIDGIANLRAGDTAFRRGEGMKRYGHERRRRRCDGDGAAHRGLQLPDPEGGEAGPDADQSEIERMTGLKVSAVNVDVQKLVKPEGPLGEQGDQWDDEGEA
jgi:uncharacterized alkaline shock family protein YloU